jgi:ABC-type transport system involved in multi-copper enzyme maturation permease subunit
VTDAIRYEWHRLVTLRSTWWLTAVAALIGIGVALLISVALRADLASGDGPSAEERELLGRAIVSQGASIFVPYLVAYVAAMIGVFAWGHEYRHGMIRATLTAVPDRTAVWVAKYLVVGGWVVVLAGLVSVASMLLGEVILSGSGIDVLTVGGWRMAVRCTSYTLVLTWLAAAFTGVVRQQVVALVLLFLWPFLIENIVSGLVTGIPWLREHFAGAVRFLPFDAGQKMVRETDGVFGGSSDALTAWEGFAVFGGCCAALMVASLVLFRSRDA